jgi:hypothetical protein
MNRIANFRKTLMQLLNEMVESRAEDLAAAMMMWEASERPERTATPVQRERRLPPRKAARPVWVMEEAKSVLGKR